MYINTYAARKNRKPLNRKQIHNSAKEINKRTQHENSTQFNKQAGNMFRFVFIVPVFLLKPTTKENTTQPSHTSRPSSPPGDAQTTCENKHTNTDNT